jgi:hypothetical protein
LIRKHNQENNNWYLGINKFADISTEELKNLYLCGKNEIKNHTDVYELETNLNLVSNVTRGLRALLMLSRIKGTEDGGVQAAQLLLLLELLKACGRFLERHYYHLRTVASGL